MKISVIIPTLNRPEDLKEALNSILAQKLLPHEVIIVDQSENMLTRELVESFDVANKARGISFIWHFRQEKGSARARNAGFRVSQGDIVCFTDDDVILEKDYFKAISRCFETYPQIGGITGNVEVLEPPSGFKWALRKWLLKVFQIDLFNGKMSSSGFGFPLFHEEIEKMEYVELFAGYSMNFRRQYLEADLFDEFFTGYSFREDVELSYRISRHTKLAAIPDALFEHKMSTSSRTHWKDLKKMQFKNYYYVFNKHKNHLWTSRLIFAYSIVGLLAIDFIEWLCCLKPNRWETFTEDLSAAVLLMLGKL